jgi:hypothetical protein
LQQILEVADFYLAQGAIHEPGFKFAINIDPIQFEVFSGSRSGKAWNKCVPYEGLYPATAQLNPGSSTWNPKAAIIGVLFQEKNFLTTQVCSMVTTQVLGLVTEPQKCFSVGSPIEGDVPSALSSVYWSDSQSLVLVWFQSGWYEFGMFTFANFQFSPLASGTFKSTSYGELSLTSAKLAISSQGDYLLFVTSAADSEYLILYLILFCIVFVFVFVFGEC